MTSHWPGYLLGPLGNYLIARPAARSAAKDITGQTKITLEARGAVQHLVAEFASMPRMM